jgi:hypothetical protein
VQAVLSGRLPSTTPTQRAHLDFPLPAFVGGEACRKPSPATDDDLLFEVTLREYSSRAGFQVALEADGRPFI